MESSETVAAVAVSTSDILRKMHFKEPQFAPIRCESDFTKIYDLIDERYRPWTYSRKPSAGGKRQHLSEPSGNAID